MIGGEEHNTGLFVFIEKYNISRFSLKTVVERFYRAANIKINSR